MGVCRRQRFGRRARALLFFGQRFALGAAGASCAVTIASPRNASVQAQSSRGLGVAPRPGFAETRPAICASFERNVPLLDPERGERVTASVAVRASQRASRGCTCRGCRRARCVRRLQPLIGEEAARGLSANVVSRLKRVWDEEGRLCVLVLIGVNARGDKHFLAIEDGVRESTQSWREVLLGLQQRGFTRPAKVAVGGGRGATARNCSPSTTSRRRTGRSCAPPT
ncbi:MAG: hypothetical protein F4Y02_12770 [Chloroflexi bacterium]|nr:hypothetical protein [Chloroflexota bacterium]